MSITGDWDRRISRRTLLKTGGSFAAGVTLAGLAGGRAFAQSSYPFTLGVASGDPSQNGVVLWTRLAPDPLAVGGGLPAEPYEVRYEVAKDEGFQKIIRSGSTVALPDEAHSVRVELIDLGPRQRVLLPLQGRQRHQPDRPHPHHAAGQRHGRVGHVRVRVVPELP